MTAVTRPAAGTQIPIPVTARHIAAGRPVEACACAVALAVSDAIPDATSVYVRCAPYPDYADARVWFGPGSWFRLSLGQAGRAVIDAVDFGQPVEPCTLTGTVA